MPCQPAYAPRAVGESPTLMRRVSAARALAIDIAAQRGRNAGWRAGDGHLRQAAFDDRSERWRGGVGDYMIDGNIFYVYEHWRPDRDECFYVGKGKAGRANQLRHNRNPLHKFIQAKLSRLGTAVEVKIVADGLSESEAFALERERIALWRADGADLANWTDGGDGPAGYKQSSDHRRKRGAAKHAYYSSPEGRAAHAKLVALAVAANTGRAARVETKQKMSETRKAMPRTPSQLALGRIGAHKTAEHIAAIVAAKFAVRQQKLAAEALGVADARDAERRKRRSLLAAERYRIKKAETTA